jgi:hypothetical protein
MPLACLKYLLSQAASATHEYEILEESPSEARAIYAGKLKVSQHAAAQCNVVLWLIWL